MLLRIQVTKMMLCMTALSIGLVLNDSSLLAQSQRMAAQAALAKLREMRRLRWSKNP